MRNASARNDREASQGAEVPEGLAIVEIQSLGAALVALDCMQKSSEIRLLQAELNDYYGIVLKLAGSVAALHSAIDAGRTITQRMGVPCTVTTINAPDSRARTIIESGPEYQPLIEQDVVFFPNPLRVDDLEEYTNMPTSPPFAIGLIETQGFTAVIEAIDTACKAANVEVIGKEKLGGGYITVLVKGDVAAVTAAVEAGKEKVDALGKLIAAHVIARPSTSILALLPKL